MSVALKGVFAVDVAAQPSWGGAARRRPCRVFLERAIPPEDGEGSRARSLRREAVDHEKLGLIAGNGTFPILFARAAARRGIEVVAVAHRGETVPELGLYVPEILWVEVGELGRLIDCFHTRGVDRVVMAGGIRKIDHLAGLRPDRRGMEFLQKIWNLNDDSLLRAVARELEGEGIRVLESTFVLEDELAKRGVLGARPPTEQERQDIELGFDVARAIGRADVGQSVVIKRGVVLAVEASEGTDETILRGGRLGGGGIVVVKASKPGQDLRFDVPAVGIETAKSLRSVNATALGLEAGKTIILDRDAFLKEVNSAEIAVLAV